MKECKECRYFEKDEVPENVLVPDVKMGKCFANPPIAAPIQQQEKFSGNMTMSIMCFRPGVAENTMQCHLFSPKLS